MKNILGLQHVIIYKIKEEEKRFLVKIGQPRKASKCVYCNHDRLHKHGKGRTRYIKHGKLPSEKRVILEWTSQRFKCPKCKRTFSKSPPRSLATGKRSYSSRFKKQTLGKLKSNSFSQTSKDLSLSYSTIRTMLEETINQKTLLAKLPEKGALSIGIDHHSNAKRSLALTITLVQPEKHLLGILPQCSAKEFNSWVKKNMTKDQRERVTEIAMDMKAGYSSILKKLFPNSKNVMDKFHILAYLHRMLIKKNQLERELRKMNGKRLPSEITSSSGLMQALGQSPNKWSIRMREKMKVSFNLFPELERLYFLKEEVKDIYLECKEDKEEARRRLSRVIKRLPKKQKKTLSKYSKGILNYFDKYTTNAFTEGVHTKFKLIKRISFGLRNPETYTRKLILAFVEPSLFL